MGNLPPHRARVVAPVIAAIALVSALSNAQSNGQMRTPPPPPTGAALKAPAPPAPPPPPRLRPVTVAPALNAAFANKKKYDASKLQNLVRVDAGGVLLKQHGREYRLLAENKPIRALTRPVSAIPQHLTKDADSIAKWKSGGAFALVIDVPTVDHRAGESPVKDQGQRGTCSAFATVAALEPLTKRKTGRFGNFSENDAFSRAEQLLRMQCTDGGGIPTWAAVEVAMTSGLCPEIDFAYTSSCAAPGIPASCVTAPHAKLTSVYQMATPAYSIPSVPNVPQHRADNVALLESWIRGGHDVVYGILVAGTDWVVDSVLDKGIIDVQLDGAGQPIGAMDAHAILLVGYDHPNKYFIFKNSWGKDTGHDGYLYISYDYVQTYAMYAFAVID